MRRRLSRSRSLQAHAHAEVLTVVHSERDGATCVISLGRASRAGREVYGEWLEEGGGWLATFPDLPGCMGDGETPEAAIEDGYAAAAAWLKVAAECGDAIPEPGAGGESGRFVARIPKSLHMRLIARARQEGVSMNTMLVSMLAESLNSRHV